ncbi:hypothetical protein MCEORH2_01250 [Methylophilaceae bacterium]
MNKTLTKIINAVKFFYVQRVIGFDVPTEPHFDEDSIKLFNDKLKSCNHYLEWGTGGSTFAAAKLGKKFIAIDSDRFFLKAVKTKIINNGYALKNDQVFYFADIGLTKEWGQPLFQRQSKSRQRRWAMYSDIPVTKINSFSPDLVLIDGRFRVACALKALRYLHLKDGFTILVDDYVDRSEYKEIERFANLVQLEGRMAVFKKKTNIDLIELDYAIKEYITDFR